MIISREKLDSVTLHPLYFTALLTEYMYFLTSELSDIEILETCTVNKMHLLQMADLELFLSISHTASKALAGIIPEHRCMCPSKKLF